MRQLLNGLGQLYPCGDCADHLREEIRRHPPDVTSRVTLSEWLCQTHNEVNRRLGKPIFDCKRVDERWRDGPADGSCD
jgi:FAD-linked sulfhydryl oxidase